MPVIEVARDALGAMLTTTETAILLGSDMLFDMTGYVPKNVAKIGLMLI